MATGFAASFFPLFHFNMGLLLLFIIYGTQDDGNVGTRQTFLKQKNQKNKKRRKTLFYVGLLHVMHLHHSFVFKLALTFVSFNRVDTHK